MHCLQTSVIIIHPHWQSTDASQPPPLKKEAVRIRISHAPYSRRSAAILGVSLAIILGIILVQNVHTITGQLTESSVVIRITTVGFEPASVTISPSATITWKNVDTKPHILSSDTLLTTDGLLYSTAIFPEEEFRTIIPDESSPGKYQYVSLTDPTMSGTVRIEEKLAYPPSPALPHNPFVAETSVTSPRHPPVSKIDPEWKQTSGTFGQSSSGAKPFRNPETGIPLGVSFLAALAVVLFLTRRILRSPHC